MFARSFTTKVPTTYEECARWWNDHPRSVKQSGDVAIAGNTRLHKFDDHYAASFHGHYIVLYYPDHKVIDACGYSGSPTTQGRIARLARVSMYSNSSLGFNECVRVDGSPYFAGMRIDNYGHVFAEDRRSDFKEVHVKAVVQKYVTLFRKIEKLTRGRWEIGEWKEREAERHVRSWQALLRIEAALAAGETFPNSADLRTLFSVFPLMVGHKEIIGALRDEHRHDYYRTNDGYETIEVK